MPGSPEIILQVPNLRAATSFYQNHLGLKIFLRQPNLIGLDATAFRLYLEEAPPLGPILEFLTDNLDQSKRELVSAGCKIIDDNPAIPRCYLRDPNGLVFNLAQRHP
jgi:catechol 2,3-dioxygenase-like lactoylglutathione lyase family enzyme